MSPRAPKSAAGLVLAALAAAATAADARERIYKPTAADQFYIACYLFSSGDQPATAFPPVKANGLEMFNNFQNNLRKDLLPQFPQHRSIRCVGGDTPQEAIQNRFEHGYSLQDRPWPKGLPEAARPVLVDGKGWIPKGAAQTVASAPPPKTTPAPKPAPQTAGLTVKTDTSGRDAAKAWDDQVKKTLAAEARKKVETAAKAAQANEETRRKIAAFWAERRRQGNRQ